MLNKPIRKYKNKNIEQQCNNIVASNRDVVLYFVSRVEHRRAFKYIDVTPNKRLEHIMLAPNATRIKNSLFKSNENYDGFLINNIITGKSINDFQLAIDILKPKIFACGTLPNFHQLRLPPECKKVFISHGMIGEHVIDIQEIKNYSGQWKGAEMYCGAGSAFVKFVNFMTGREDNNIVLNAMPQLDIIYRDQDSFVEFKDTLLKNKLIPQAEKYILFVGFSGAKRSDFKGHNIDYYRTAVYLSRLAKKNGWFIFIKPRTIPSLDVKHITSTGFPELHQYAEEYKALYYDKNICMAHRLESIYKYFFCDTVILNGTSTVEVEACCANKPVVIVRTNVAYDPLRTVSFGAAKHVSTDSIEDLENNIIAAEDISIGSRNNLLEYHGITFDGKMGKRVAAAVEMLYQGGTYVK